MVDLTFPALLHSGKSCFYLLSLGSKNILFPCINLSIRLSFHQTLSFPQTLLCICYISASNNTNTKYRLFPSQSAQSGYSCSVAQSCLTLCHPMDCSIRGFLSFTAFHFLKLMPIGSMMPSNDLILCHPLFLLPSIFSQHQGLFK